MVTDANGFYKFKTVIPGAYPVNTDWLRPPHIHFKVTHANYQELITQMYFAGNNLNSQDLILMQLSEQERSRVLVQLNDPMDLMGERKITREGVFDIVLTVKP